MADDKPPYSVLSMEEINALPWNGLNVISTFAGGGGSSLGYRMAGYRVLAAAEFVPAAAETYEANAAEYTTVVTDDIRDVHGENLLATAGLAVGELDVLDGSPPCAAFSTAGKKSKGWGEVKSYSDTEQRVDDLFYDYARLVREIRPRVFVAENVPGLVMGEAKGYFKRVYAELGRDGYRVGAQILDAQWLGVPQARRRLIFVGVRDDQKFEPVFPSPLSYRYSMRDALPHLAGQVAPGATNGKGWAKTPSWRDAAASPSGTIGASFQTGNGRFPVGVVADRFVTKGFSSAPEKEWSLDEPIATITANGASSANNGASLLLADEAPDNTDGLTCPESGQDLLSISARLRASYPDRHLRRLSIPEVRRLCSFPPDFELRGSYSRRWERMGRAVPPLMMKAIAERLAVELCAD